MKTIRLELVMQATQPVSHTERTEGNIGVMMRETFIGADGVDEAPIISGDAMRHQLREAGAWMTLRAAGIEGDLSQGAVRLLFAGGGIGGAQGTSIDISSYRDMVKVHPTLALFGGGVGNRLMPGRLEVGRALLICKETVEAGLLTDWAVKIASGDVPYASDCVVQETRVRMDPLLKPVTRNLLGDDAEADFAAKILAGEKGDTKAKAAAKSTMMPRTGEVLISGSLLFWTITAKVDSEILESAFWATLGCALADFKVGGKSGSGHGQLRLLACQQYESESAAEAAMAINPLGITRDHLDRFNAHMAENVDGFKTFIEGVKA